MFSNNSISQSAKTPAGVLTLIIGFPVTIAMGWYFKSDPPKSGDPVYTITDHIKVYSEDSENPKDKPITGSDSKGNKIESNVYRLRLALVNRGNKGLEGSSFADKIEIKPLEVTILDAKIVLENDRDNTAFQLKTATRDENDPFEIVEANFNQWLPTKRHVDFIINRSGSFETVKERFVCLYLRFSDHILGIITKIRFVRYLHRW